MVVVVVEVESFLCDAETLRFDVEMLRDDLLLRFEMVLALRWRRRFGFGLAGSGGGPMSPIRPNVDACASDVDPPSSESARNELSIFNKCRFCPGGKLMSPTPPP